MKTLKQYIDMFKTDHALMGSNYGLQKANLRPSTGRRSKHTWAYKPAFTCGFRGFPRMSYPPGMTPAPTLDQVRRLERKYSTKLVVHRGLIFFKQGGDMFTKDIAAKRKAVKLSGMINTSHCCS